MDIVTDNAKWMASGFTNEELSYGSFELTIAANAIAKVDRSIGVDPEGISAGSGIVQSRMTGSWFSGKWNQSYDSAIYGHGFWVECVDAVITPGDLNRIMASIRCVATRNDAPQDWGLLIHKRLPIGPDVVGLGGNNVANAHKRHGGPLIIQKGENFRLDFFMDAAGIANLALAAGHVRVHWGSSDELRQYAARATAKS